MLFCEEAAAAVLNSLSLTILEDIGSGPLDGNWPFPLALILNSHGSFDR